MKKYLLIGALFATVQLTAQGEGESRPKVEQVKNLIRMRIGENSYGTLHDFEQKEKTDQESAADLYKSIKTFVQIVLCGSG